MEISKIYDTVRLLKKVNCSTVAYIGEVAKEIGMKKTALMLFIEENPGFFNLYEPKPQDKKSRAKGLAIRECYLHEDENPETNAWTERMKKEWERKIQVFEKSYYGYHEFFYIGVDDGNYKDRCQLWRNTKEKIDELVNTGLITEKTRNYGGWGNCSTFTCLVLTDEEKEKIETAGWTLVYPDTK